MRYAGFWKRFVAYVIDIIPLFFIGIVLAMISGQDLLDPDATSGLGFTDLIGLIIGVVYYAGFESSSWQATPGKRAMGMIVTDTNGRRISPLRAVGRYFAKIPSAMILLIGFIMVAFTDRKQGLR
jgi:uncharacterized RDD family membrane protein YckC